MTLLLRTPKLMGILVSAITVTGMAAAASDQLSPVVMPSASFTCANDTPAVLKVTTQGFATVGIPGESEAERIGFLVVESESLHMRRAALAVAHRGEHELQWRIPDYIFTMKGPTAFQLIGAQTFRCRRD